MPGLLCCIAFHMQAPGALAPLRPPAHEYSKGLTALPAGADISVRGVGAGLEALDGTEDETSLRNTEENELHRELARLPSWGFQIAVRGSRV